TSPNLLSTLQKQFACARLSGPCLLGSCPNVSATLTTTAFDRSRSRWFGIGYLIAEPEGPSFISTWHDRRSAKSDLSINPAQTFLYLLSNRVGGPIRYGFRVRRDSIRTRGDLARWLKRACYRRRINANWARSACIKIAFSSRIE